MNNPSYYSVIPATVRYDKNLTPNAKLLYAEITSLSQKNGYCYAGDAYFAELYSVGKSSIQNWMKALESNGYISRELQYKEGTKEISCRYTRILDGGTPNICRDNNINNNNNKIKPKGFTKVQKEKEVLTAEQFAVIFKAYKPGCRVIPDCTSLEYKRTVKAVQSLGSVEALGEQVMKYLHYLKSETWRKQKGYKEWMNSPEHYGNNWEIEKSDNQNMNY